MHFFFFFSVDADWAVQNRHLACVKLLLEGIPDIDVLAQNGFGRGSVTEAFQSDDTDICTYRSQQLAWMMKRKVTLSTCFLCAPNHPQCLRF